jgi:hypothetical protein
MDGFPEHWLDAHPHVCGYLFALFIIPTIHLYVQTWTIRKVAKMRKGDGLFMQGPRRSRRSRPPLPIDEDKTPT